MEECPVIDAARFRSQFSITDKRAYLFAGAIAPAADAVRQAAQEWIQAWAVDPLANYDAAFTDMVRVREAIGGILGVDGSRITLSENTSQASNLGVRLLARGSAGSNVVVDRTTYPSSRYPWLTIANAEIRAVTGALGEAMYEAIEHHTDDETIAIVVSHVDPLTGFRHDLQVLREIAARHGAALMVDIAQSAGAVPLPDDLAGIDIAVGTTMKWLLGPPGIGYLYARPGLGDDVTGLDVGYMSFTVDGEKYPQSTLPPVADDGRRFELGLGNMAGMQAAVAGIELLQQIGVPAVFEHVSDLAETCIAGLTELGFMVRTPAERRWHAGVVAFESPFAHELAAFLKTRGVDIGGYDWGLGRVDPHAFNNADDITRLLDGVRSFRLRAQ
jgi:cysteine desulfurase / selenocysteine lyase